MCLFLDYFFVNRNKLFIHQLSQLIQKHLLHHGIAKFPETLGWISNEEGRDDCPMQELQLSGRLLGFDPFGWGRAVSPLPNKTLQNLHFQKSRQALAVGLAQCTPSSKPIHSRQLIGSGDGRRLLLQEGQKHFRGCGIPHSEAGGPGANAPDPLVPTPLVLPLPIGILSLFSTEH